VKLADVLPRAGRKLGDVTVGDMLASGSFGLVHKAFDNAGKMLVLKWLNLIFWEVPSVCLHFWKEMDVLRYLARAQADGRLRPGSVPDIKGHGEIYGVPFIIMEYIEGMTLADAIHQQESKNSRSRREWLKLVVSLLLDVCTTLRFCHDHGIIHQDLKPSNLMLTKLREGEGSEWRAVVIDFGLAYAPASVSPFVYQKGRMGTPGFIPPEHARIQPGCDAPISPKSDTFSLCAVLCRCVYGEPVYGRVNETELLRRAEKGILSLPAEHPTDPPGLWEIVERGTRVDPEARYANISELIDALKLFQEALLTYEEAHRQRVSRVIVAVCFPIFFVLGYLLGRY
jgi:serine/threonine-protein kinase